MRIDKWGQGVGGGLCYSVENNLEQQGGVVQKLLLKTVMLFAISINNRIK